MKKILAFALAVCLVVSLGAAAFAAPSVQKKEASEDVTTALPVIPEGAEVEICLLADDAAQSVIPAEAVKLVPLAGCDELDEADKEAFLAAYEDAKAIEDQVVKYFFWFGVEEEYKEVPEGDYVSFKFICKGENVRVLLNGEEAEVAALDEENGYVAKLPGFGAVAILCDAK